MPISPAPEDRVENVESLLMHLQRDFDSLSGVIWRQQAEIDTLKKEVQRLGERFATEVDGTEERDPLAEQPPHY
ncbi:MAG: SlyX family protein [Planctomycetia bacterium]|nr:SlyX family protein [Planctomycetia bacterium]